MWEGCTVDVVQQKAVGTTLLRGRRKSALSWTIVWYFKPISSKSHTLTRTWYFEYQFCRDVLDVTISWTKIPWQMCVWSLLRIAPVSRCLCRSWETVSLFPWWVISFLSCEQATWVVVARAVGVILRIFFRDLRIWIPNTKNIPRISTALFWYIHRIRGNQKHAIFERNCLMQTVLKFVVFKPNSGVPPMWLRCEDPECQRQPTYGHKGDKRPRFCSTHKQPGMYDVIARRCEVPGCMTRAAFNFQGQKSVKYCAVHKEEGMENLKSKCCEVLCYFTAADDDDSFFCCAVCVSPSGIHQTCLGVGASRINFYVL